jgi:hypothetical protein
MSHSSMSSLCSFMSFFNVCLWIGNQNLITQYKDLLYKQQNGLAIVLWGLVQSGLLSFLGELVTRLVIYKRKWPNNQTRTKKKHKKPTITSSYWFVTKLQSIPVITSHKSLFHTFPYKMWTKDPKHYANWPRNEWDIIKTEFDVVKLAFKVGFDDISLNS